jgi:tripartite ATP-independent transporter DctM subunit
MNYLIAILMPILLLLGFPFKTILLGTLLLALTFFLPGFDLTMLVQQVLTGMKPFALLCIPMFILTASIVTAGDSAKRLIRVLRALIGHVPGGLPITCNAACTVFGSVSGSTQATVAAIGGTMRPMLLRAGYSDSFSMGLIINSSDIANMIPPSIGFVVYGVATSTSVGRLFLSGVIPGIIIFAAFSVYSFFYSKAKNVGIAPKASRKERLHAIQDGLLLIGFPVLVIGGIYSGYMSPTEASAATAAYALILELLVYRSLTLKDIPAILIDTGMVTTVVWMLIGAGQAFSWVLSFMQVPQQVIPQVLGVDPAALKVIIFINIAYLIACMFVDPIVAIYILSPIFGPYVDQAGIDKVFLGCLVTLQVAIGSATPPFGCDIFTAQVIFKRPYIEVIRKIGPFIAILIAVNIMLIAFPGIALWLPNLAFG